MTRLLLIALLCAPLCAQVKVGDDAPDFSPRNWINPPTFNSFDELAGDVILLKAWGINCTGSMSQLDATNKLAQTPGLHVVTFYAQTHKLEQIEAVVKSNNITYPIALDETPWLAGYDAPDLPKVWIIGTDGKIKFAGTDSFDDVLKAELAMVKYPGLGKQSIAKGLEPAAKLFVAGKYKEAYAAAEKMFDETDDEAEEDDADWIMKRIDGRINTLSVRAATSEVLKEYALAMRCWEELARYKGLDDAEEAPARLKKLQENADVKKEIAARRSLLVLMCDLDVEFQVLDDSEPATVKIFREKCLKAYQEFSSANKGTGAADRADELVKAFKQLLGIPEEPAKQEPPTKD
ncbi:MAG: redoxin domain-containing protein [Planctomycetes bacterium]|nr:redoxin domain-containing protein [Planctomycetota bacterium]